MFELGSTDSRSAVEPAELVDVESAVDALVRVDVAGLDGSVLRRFAVQLEREAARVDAVRAIVAAQLDDQGHTEEWFGLRTGHWIAKASRTPVGVQKRRVTVSSRLIKEFPDLLAAMAAGHISWFHADAFCHVANPRIAELMGLLVDELVTLARGIGFGPWLKELRRVAARLDVDGAEPADGDDSKVFMTRRIDGVREFAGRFAGPDGAAFEEMLDAETDHQYRLAQHLAEQTGGETEIPTRAQLRAAALLELVRRGHAAKHAATGGTAVELTIARHTHDGCCAPPEDPTAAVRQATDDLFETTYGDVFRSGQLETQLCDPFIGLAELQLAGLDGTELNLKLGRSQRLGSPAQRKAAFLRDGGCVFPGCDAHGRHCDLHHVNWWEKGGLTDIENLACLCRFHHGITPTGRAGP